MFGTLTKNGKEMNVPITTNFSITMPTSYITENDTFRVPRKLRANVLDIEQEILDACSEMSDEWFGKHVSSSDLDELLASNVKTINMKIPDDLLTAVQMSQEITLNVSSITLCNNGMQLNWTLNKIVF